MMTTIQFKPTNIDVAQNSRNDVLISIDMKAPTEFEQPALLYKVEGETFKAIIRDQRNRNLPGILFPKLKRSEVVSLLDAVQPYKPRPGEDPDGRVEGQRYVLVSEVIGAAPAKVYYALLKRF